MDGWEAKGCETKMCLNLHFRLHQMDLVLSVIFIETNSSLRQMYMLWFNFILGLKFYFSLYQMHYHTTSKNNLGR